ncbi:ABC transporter substrate-binding protein [Paenibacillus xerothermodurans]|nr:sugar ABC transporter substrate-binding protein [Paenibacillus xerothermodurans]
MPKRKLLSVLIGAALAAALTAGCTTDSTDAGGQVTIKMSVSGSEQEKKLRYETADLFMQKHPNIKIEWVDLGTDRYQKTMTLVSGGEAPDILYLNDWVFPFAEKGVLMPLDEFIEGDASFNLDSFYKPLVDAFRVDGKLYALTQEVSPLVMYYNKDMFDKQGGPYPTDDWTEQEFIETAKKLTDSGQRQYGYLIENGVLSWGGFLNRAGAHIYSSDGTKSGFDTPEALNALRLMHRIAVQDRSSPNPAEQKAQGQGSDAQFRNGQVAMFASGLWQLPAFKAEPLPFQWDVVRMPKGVTQTTKAGVLEWGISAETKHPKEAWEVLKFFVGPEGMNIVAKYNMALPATQDNAANQMILDSKFPDNVKAFIASAPMVNLEEVTNMRSAEINLAVTQEIDLMLLGTQSPEETQTKIVSTMNQILSE